mgnify:CR=1 FL=1
MEKTKKETPKDKTSSKKKQENFIQKYQLLVIYIL